jgi:uncharacterized protein DUF2569/uncharacterized protein DUF4339
MSDEWYYAEGEAARGPMTLAELASMLVRFSDPYHVPVWRPGFERWQWAEDVTDVAAALAHYRGSDPSRLTPTRRAIPHATTSTRVVASELSGIGGWLILMAIWQVFWPLRFLVSKIWYYATFDTALFKEIPVAMLGEGVINIALALLYAFTVICFFATSRRFPRFFIYQVVAAVLVLPLSAVWVAVVASLETGAPAWPLFESAFEAHEVAQVVVGAIIGGIWILYLLKSRRVANTFVD